MVGGWYRIDSRTWEATKRAGGLIKRGIVLGRQFFPIQGRKLESSGTAQFYGSVWILTGERPGKKVKKDRGQSWVGGKKKTSPKSSWKGVGMSSFVLVLPTKNFPLIIGGERRGRED